MMMLIVFIYTEPKIYDYVYVIFYVYNVYEYELLLCFIQSTALAKGWKNICQVGTNCNFNLRYTLW